MYVCLYVCKLHLSYLDGNLIFLDILIFLVGLPFSEPLVLQLGSIATGTHAAMPQVA